MDQAWRARVADALEGGGQDPVADAMARTAMLVVIIVSVGAIVLETVPGLGARAGHLFSIIDNAAVLVLAADYLCRVWVAPDRRPGDAAAPWQARLRYLVSIPGLIDLLAVLPFLLGLAVPIPVDWLRVLRLLRLLKIARYAPGLTLFAAVIRNEARPLVATLVVVIVALVLESGVMYVLERDAQPTLFASIPHAMWWGIVTIATVGYGDVYPITVAGRLFAGVVIVLGIALFAVPAGILATGFATEIRKREFVVTWQSVAKVPLFAGLDATRIAEIARLLQPQVVPAQFAVVRRGEPADAMFFIMAGQVEVDVQPHAVRLGPGQYFGEIALLRDTMRTATVTAVSECQLLSLSVVDFRRLLENNPSLRDAVNQVAAQRLAALQGAEAAVPPAARPPGR
jgi:voltage-gated potassium channel